MSKNTHILTGVAVAAIFYCLCKIIGIIVKLATDSITDFVEEGKTASLCLIAFGVCAALIYLDNRDEEDDFEN